MVIDGNKVKSDNNKENYYKMALNEISKEKTEKICSIVENIELKILIRIINKMERKKYGTVYKKEDMVKARDRLYTQPIYCNNFDKPGISIKEKIKIFNGEFIKKKIYRNQTIPGKLRIPSIFLPPNQKNKKDDTNKENEKKSD